MAKVTVRELREQAKKVGLKNRSKMTKEQLIAALRMAEIAGVTIDQIKVLDENLQARVNWAVEEIWRYGTWAQAKDKPGAYNWARKKTNQLLKAFPEEIVREHILPAINNRFQKGNK